VNDPITLAMRILEDLITPGVIVGAPGRQSWLRDGISTRLPD